MELLIRIIVNYNLLKFKNELFGKKPFRTMPCVVRLLTTQKRFLSSVRIDKENAHPSADGAYVLEFLVFFVVFRVTSSF